MAAGTWVGLILLIIGLIIGISFTVTVIHDNSKKKKTSVWNIIFMILGYIVALIGLVWLIASMSGKKKNLPECQHGCDVGLGEKNVDCHGRYLPGTPALQTCLNQATAGQQACNADCQTKFPVVR